MFHALHLHDYEGRIRFDTHGERELLPGGLTLTPIDESTWYDLPRPGTHYCVHFHHQPIAGEDDAVCIELPLYVPVGHRRGEAECRFAQIAHAVFQRNRADQQGGAASGDTSKWQSIADIAMHDLLLWVGSLSAGSNAPQSPGEAAVAEVLRIIDMELHRPLVVSELANRVGLSQAVLARRFKGVVGQTLPRYILTSRMNAAQILLASTELPVKAIAARVGMPDPHHFNKQFRYFVGISPSEARRVSRPDPPAVA